MAPRLRQVRRADAAESVLPFYDLAFGDRDPVDQPGTAWGTLGTWWTVLALVPEILDQTRGFAALYTNPAFRLDPKLRELAVTRAGWASESQFVFTPHRKLGRDWGVTEEQMEAIPSWSTADCFSSVERAVLAYTDAWCSVADASAIPRSRPCRRSWLTRRSWNSPIRFRCIRCRPS